ncbi:hypothetical protein GYMLUDRAFT_160186 [Collybiopsis luxurians FD-317 M1]|nr:hypothetical protein GYMLUDRAFT_160186 [Collybiopsis luxurians FD-317 M1]
MPGTWILDMASQVPSGANWKLQGIDISRALFPASPPNNVLFSQESMLSLPRTWENRFDFLEQCMMFSALTKNEWPIALSEALRVLKPGGHAQFIEVINPSGQTAAIQRQETIMRGLFEIVGLDSDAALRLPQRVRDAGFAQVVCDIRTVRMNTAPIDRELDGGIPLFASVLQAAFGKLKRKVVDCGLISKDEFEELMEQLEKDWTTSDEPRYGYFVVVSAQKGSGVSP